MNTPAHPDQRFGNVTYAQHGDDLLLLAIFDRLGIQKPFYIDIGAHHPTIISNTKLLYDRGATGINVDANKLGKPLFDRDRPLDINLFGIGIGPVEGVFDFHIYGPRSGRNTLSLDEVKSLDGVLTVQKIEKIHVITYAQLIEKYTNGRIPDLLLVDAEGMDYDILNSINFDHVGYPTVICVETRLGFTDIMIRMLGNRHYSVYCRMGENLFFIRDDKFDLVLGFRSKSNDEINPKQR